VDLSGRHLYAAPVALHDQAGDRLRHDLGPGHDVLRLGVHVIPGPGTGDQTGAGNCQGGRGDQAGQAPYPAARAGYRAHGRSTVSRVGPPGGLAISRVPSTDSARRASPARPVPRAGSAPPTPSSVTMMCNRSPSRCTNTSAWLAWECLGMLVRPSETTK